ncbi:MAG: glycosyltransferase family 4 protein [Anaerolineae bacterium]|nr:glycosyltransferase family 4 protein [Anaerolineae bacterium]
MKILFLSAWLPYPPINGAKIRIYNLIRQLAKKHEITLLAFARTLPIEPSSNYMPELEKYCRSVRVVAGQEFNPRSLTALRGFFSSVPRSVIQTFSDEMLDLLNDALHREKFDVVIASEVSPPSLVSFLASRITDTPKILDALEIALAKEIYQSQTRLDRKIRTALTWFKLRAYTRDLLLRSSGCTIPSLEEKEIMQGLVPAGYPIEIVPHSLDLDRYMEIDEPIVPNSLAFTGSFTYHPNLDAVQYFTNTMFQSIRDKEPATRLKVIGNLNGVEPTQFPGYQSMSFTGLLRDVRADVAKSWLSIVPLRLGAGTRLKIVESMALGTPVVSTSKGAEGLEVVHGENILIADTPEEFSDAVLSVLQSPPLREKLSKGGRALVAEKYDSEAVGRIFDAFMERVVNSYLDRKPSLR